MDRNNHHLAVDLVESVALRKESVDRNDDLKVPDSVSKVALRKESVDRNIRIPLKLNLPLRRSPQGERG